MLLLLANIMTWAHNPAWSEQELSKANTAKDISQLSAQERDIVLYLNLARLYPKKFVEVELLDYYGGNGFESMLSPNRLSLVAELYEADSACALVFYAAQTKEARCLANEQRKNGEVGHTRHKCSRMQGGECCAYGPQTGREIVLQLLIDEGVDDLGHRANCLNNGFGSIGVAIATHPKFDYCAILDFGWGDYNQRTSLRNPAGSKIAEQDKYFEMMTRNVPTQYMSLPRERVISVSTATHTVTNGSTTTTSTETILQYQNGKTITIKD